MPKEKDSVIITFFACLVGLIIPLFLLPLEKILPYPYFLEEGFKALIIFMIIKNIGPKKQNRTVFLFALLFAFSENLFYLNNFIALGLMGSFLQRLLLTTTLHLLTSFMILLAGQKKLILFPIGLILAILTHFLYNHFVVILF